MKKKKRYEFINENNYLVDNEQNTTICDFCELTLFPEIVVDLLNQQDSQISKLQASYKQVNEESKQLKLDCVIYKSTIDELNKSQKQLAIDVLERLHNDFASSIGNGMLRTYVCGLIKDKISELKGELK